MEALIPLTRQDLAKVALTERGSQILDLIPDPRPRTEEEAVRSHRARAIRRLVAKLPGRERQVIVASFGLGGEAELSLRQIAIRFGLSKTEAWRIRDRALARLRAQMGPREE